MARALAISLALHAVLLLQSLPAAPNKSAKNLVSPTANFLDVSLRAGAGAPAIAANVPALAALIAGSTPRKLPTPAPDLAEPRALPSPDMRVAFPAPGESRSAPPGRTAIAAPISRAHSAGVTASAGEGGLDANGLRAYRLDLATTARRFKRYPPQALEQGLSGTVEVRIGIAANGVPQSAQLLSSSGHQLLDAAALEMLGNAARHTEVPTSLRGQPFSVPLPVVFGLDSE